MEANYSSPLPPTISPSHISSLRGKGESDRPFTPAPREDKRRLARARKWEHLLMSWYLAKTGVVWKKSPAPASKTKLFITYGWVAKSSLPRDGLNYTCYMLRGLSPVWNYMQAAGGFAALRKVRIYSTVSCKSLLCRNGHFVFIFSFWDKHIMIRSFICKSLSLCSSGSR